MDTMSDKKGIICVVACPLLEDELIHSMFTDPQPKRILVADNEHAVSIKRKVDGRGMRYEMITEKEFFDRRDNIDREQYNIMILMNSLGLHAEPGDLKKKVEDDILRIGSSCDCISLYYGLCGNAMWDPVEWAKKKVDVPVHIFRGCDGEICDDCVGVAVSGTKRYLQLLKKHPGQLLVIPAMAENWEEFLQHMDMMQGASSMDMNKYEYMRWMFELCGYEFAVKIDTGLGDHDLYEVKSKELADSVGLKLIEGEPEFINRFSTDDMYEKSKAELPDA